VSPKPADVEFARRSDFRLITLMLWIPTGDESPVGIPFGAY